MQWMPLDMSQMRMIATGKCMPRPLYAELSDGTNKRVPGGQEKDELTGSPLWTVDCIPELDGDEDDDGRAEIAGVLVPSVDRPVLAKFQPVMFEDLMVNVYTRKDDWRVTFKYKAGGIVTRVHSQPKAA